MVTRWDLQDKVRRPRPREEREKVRGERTLARNDAVAALPASRGCRAGIPGCPQIGGFRAAEGKVSRSKLKIRLVAWLATEHQPSPSRGGSSISSAEAEGRWVCRGGLSPPCSESFGTATR